MTNMLRPQAGVRGKARRIVVSAALALVTVVTVALVPSTAFASKVSPQDYNGPITVARLTRTSPNQVAATGNTVGWNRGTITIEGVLFRDEGGSSTLIWDRTNTCYNSTSCTLPTYYTPCACGQTYELYVYAHGPSTDGHTTVNDYTYLPIT